MVPLFSFETNFVKKITGYTNSLIKFKDGMKKGRSDVDRPYDVGGKQLPFLPLGVTQIHWVALLRKGGGSGKNAVLHCFPCCGSAG
jgi:hypothetical protein